MGLSSSDTILLLSIIAMFLSPFLVFGIWAIVIANLYRRYGALHPPLSPEERRERDAARERRAEEARTRAANNAFEMKTEKSTIIAIVFAGVLGAIVLWVAILHLLRCFRRKGYHVDQFFAVRVAQEGHEQPSFFHFWRHNDVQEDYGAEKYQDEADFPLRSRYKRPDPRSRPYEEQRRYPGRGEFQRPRSRSWSRERHTIEVEPVIEEARDDTPMPSKRRRRYDRSPPPRLERYARGMNVAEPPAIEYQNHGHQLPQPAMVYPVQFQMPAAVFPQVASGAAPMIAPVFAAPIQPVCGHQVYQDHVDKSIFKSAAESQPPSAKPVHRTVHFVDFVDELPPWVETRAKQPSDSTKHADAKQEADSDEEIEQIPRAYIPRSALRARNVIPEPAIFPQAFIQSKTWKKTPALRHKHATKMASHGQERPSSDNSQDESEPGTSNLEMSTVSS
ncbi:hypothetical protein BU24DRAFT_461521 [Aaosphaeria arxii CBS 175.79]|uniref:Uncharacterized protein n=1 Tax=Aaosphaeria arxii CBS 175.79 TaxID=1450172 RepID=A0A6A5XQU3_9PLEO|nr:uncharacterized protein BU24DRAFT_461521 [Aaosphaeria arxii CBS 175.79]KAF2015269.1 hypothetical protein BU24DRAFT_461521 [Aaosphaeria arxii CBS 175.79]